MRPWTARIHRERTALNDGTYLVSVTGGKASALELTQQEQTEIITQILGRD